MTRPTLSLGQQIAALFGVVSIALVATSLFVTERSGRRQAIQGIESEIAGAADHFSDALDRGMFERFREVRLLAGDERIWRGDVEAIGAVKTEFSRRRATLPEIAWLGFATPDGTVRSASEGMLQGASVSERPWFQEGLQRPWAGDLHEAKLLAQKFAPRPDGAPFRFVDVAAPVHDTTGKVLGVVGAHLSWAWAEDVRTNLLNQAKDADALILSADGKVLLGPDFGTSPFSPAQLAEMRRKGRGTMRVDDGSGLQIDGYATTNGYRDYPGLGWIVVVRKPAAVAFANVNAASRSIMIVGVVIALAGLATVWLLASRLTKPIRELAAAAKQIGRDPHATMPRLGGSRDIVELSGSLRALVRHVDAAERQARDISERSDRSAQLFEKEISTLRVAAETDPLTGRLNRRAFLVAAEDALQFRKRYGGGFAILMVDIDHFKKVNDTFGHATGDAVIRNVGETLSDLVRVTDKVARFGGEEFVVLLREVGEAEVTVLAKRMREAVRRSTVDAGGAALSVSVSIGGTLASDQDDDVHGIIDRADRGLYAAKLAGRDRAVVVPGESEIRQAA